MLLTVIDGNGVKQTIVAQAQANPVDRSGVISNALTPQVIMGGNVARAGFFFQNTDPNDTQGIIVNIFGGGASNGVIVFYGQSFPPPGFPVPTAPITVIGPKGATFTAYEW